MADFIYYDEKGKAIGIGSESQFRQKVGEGEAVQDVVATRGSYSTRKEAIDEKTAEEIKDPKNPKSLKDFNL